MLSKKDMLGQCDTLMLDMDGTLLDLAYDNFMWLKQVPIEYARLHGMPEAEARNELYAKMMKLRGTLDWYCLDFWSEQLSLDVVDLHRQHNERITWLPGAEGFVRLVAASGMRVLLVTNSHSATLDIKHEVTGLKQYFDGVYTSHALGAPKEKQSFWEALADQEDFDPERTMFIDDNTEVLDSARTFGVRHLVAIEEPDSSAPARRIDGYSSVDRVARLSASLA